MPFPAHTRVTVHGPADDVRRLARSAAAVDEAMVPTDQFHEWFTDRGRRNRYQVRRAPIDRLHGWRTDPATGNLEHLSGRFFSVQGLEVSTAHRETREWAQPIIVQPEVGILGILVKEFGGVLHCLMQAKTEPGNVNALQLSPTVQATRSNYTRVHRGNAIPYLEYFDGEDAARVMVHTLQSEQGASFLHKRNRNMVVEATGDVPVRDGFCWLTLGQLNALLAKDNLVHMDARSVMSVIPVAAPPAAASAPDDFRGALARSLADQPRHHTGLLSWFTGVKSRRALDRRLVPLDSIGGWRREADRISHESGKYFSVIGVDVEASDREVPSWSQPLLAPARRGVLGLLTRRVDGVLEVLVQARTEAGTLDVVELAPSVQCVPENYEGVGGRLAPGLLGQIPSGPDPRIRFDAIHSEEGGRFYHAENRYVIAEIGGDFPEELPDGHAWATVRELNELVRHGHYLNVEARCLLACLHSLL
ncbi:NDP-hexose 2,3-dehydratase family protein [Actinomadura harenae]|uniref:NDP-hexose 2,3-dehydratase n=1 Tax=Actinomadura harenae TaxID=2483351 RepID=A0A3M2M157_9ACTN|nr:NDP-hexose 2,3-dehydratase family protein [Actinomadura harenae]RMI43172.1 NDP-hexose 2,3-dehydratase [Actinomadura harenae]